MALARALAASADLPLWRWLTPDAVTPSLPVPHFNVLNGGVHATELGNLMAQRPADLATRERAREMPIYKRYFDLMAAGHKTIEVRVAYPSNKRLAAGHLLKFTCRGEECLTRIVRIATYPDFDDMFNHEKASAVNPTATREQQLASIRLIYPAEKEALGVIAIEVERV